MKYESIQYINVFKKYRPETIFLTEIKGHNSDNNQWILSLIELALYFMITYLCMKYEPNIPMYSKDMAHKPFFIWSSRAILAHNKWWILSVIKLDLYFMIIYMCMKYEYNRTPMYLKDMARKPFFVRTGHTRRTGCMNRHRTRMITDTICPPPPPPTGAYKKIGKTR